MDATTAVLANHADVEQAFAAFDRAEGSRTGQYRAMLAVSDALAAHAACEQELLWPALQDRTGRHDDSIERQLELAHLLELLLIELGAMTPADRRFAAKVGLLLELFRQHARDTELALLPELRRRLDPRERAQLGQELAARGRWFAAGPRALAAR